jgi:hypothetical protein
VLESGPGDVANCGEHDADAQADARERIAAAEHDWPTICPGCQRRMSDREAKEQGVCNECQAGAR